MNTFQQRVENNRAFFVVLVIGVWTAFGLFFGTQIYVRDAYTGKAGALPGYIIGWLLCGYAWGILTVPVLKLLRHFSLARLAWSRFLLVHLPAAAVFASLQLAVYTLIVAVLAFVGGGPSRSITEYYEWLFVKEFQSSFLVYAAIIASVTAYWRIFRADAIQPEPELPEVIHQIPNHNRNGNGNGYLKRVAAKDNGRIALVEVQDIDWIESYGNYLFLHTAGGRHMIRETMAAMEEKLDPEEFVRIRRSAIVRSSQIDEMRSEQNGEYEIRLKSGVRLSSTRRYRKNIETVLKA